MPLGSLEPGASREVPARHLVFLDGNLRVSNPNEPRLTSIPKLRIPPSLWSTYDASRAKRATFMVVLGLRDREGLVTRCERCYLVLQQAEGRSDVLDATAQPGRSRTRRCRKLEGVSLGLRRATSRAERNGGRTNVNSGRTDDNLLVFAAEIQNCLVGFQSPHSLSSLFLK